MSSDNNCSQRSNFGFSCWIFWFNFSHLFTRSFVCCLHLLRKCPCCLSQRILSLSEREKHPTPMIFPSQHYKHNSFFTLFTILYQFLDIVNHTFSSTRRKPQSLFCILNTFLILGVIYFKPWWFWNCARRYRGLKICWKRPCFLHFISRTGNGSHEFAGLWKSIPGRQWQGSLVILPGNRVQSPGVCPTQISSEGVVYWREAFG